MSSTVIERMLAEPDPSVRAHWFDELGRRNADTRPGVGLIDGIPDLLWRRVPAGQLLDGRRPTRSRRVAWPSGRPGRRLLARRLPGDRSRQFQAFIDAGGYTERFRDCWPSIGWRWKQRYNIGTG